MWMKIVKNNINIIRTSNIYLSMLNLGLSISITGPCLLDLQRLVNTDTQHIAFIYTARSLGYLVGAILGGVVLDLVRSKMLVMTICNLFVTITMLGIPWSRTVVTLLGFAVVNGLSLGAIETGSNVVTIHIWGSGPVLQALHFTFGLGGLISPLIAAPFLEDQTQNSFINNTDYNFSTSTTNFSTSTTANFTEETVGDGVAKLTYPFSAVGVFSLLVTTLFFVTWLISPDEASGSTTAEEDDSTSSWLFNLSTIVFTFLIFFVLIGVEIGFGQTLATYAVKSQLRATAAVASYMTSAIWGTFMTARLASVFLSIKISSATLLAADLSLITLAGCMLLFGMPDEGVLWAAAVVYGVGIASAYASLIGWLDGYIAITSRISAILTVGCAAGEMVVPFVIAFYLDTVPEMLAYAVPASSVVATVLILVLYAIIRQQRNKKECAAPKQSDCYVIS